ncbi:MAG TPA: ABC transporter permease [Acidimicrobiales bacterium]|jgi:peptide/nickel transport system permease protein|nr:ABC transporter permease [Acidimicrobiales bacterium]
MSTVTAPTPVPTLTDELAATQRQRRKLPPLSLVFAVLWLGVLTFMGVFADYLPFVRNYDQQVGYARSYGVGPGADFWFGSDKLGRDVFARCIYGARVSMLIAVTSIIVGMVLGGLLGLIAGYFRGRTDRGISILNDVLLAFPPLVLALVLSQRLGRGVWQVILVLSILSIAPLARIVRAQTLSISQREYVLAARSIGARSRRVLVREILPNLVPTMISVAFTGIAVLLIAEGGLAFLGYSVKPPQPTWGYMIQESRADLDDAWWATLFPCFMLFVTVLAFNIVGDRVARRFDIREAAL